MSAFMEPNADAALTLRIYRRGGTSRLPWVLDVPCDPTAYLAASAPWPVERTVFCFELASLPPEAVLQEEIPLVACHRQGDGVTLVADRKLQRRTNIHFMEDGSRRAWWNSAATTAAQRPGRRVPLRNVPTGELQIQVDTRERYPFRFHGRQATLNRVRLDVGDYAVTCRAGAAAVERKSLGDFASAAVTGSLSYQMDELATLARAAVVVEARYGRLVAVPHVRPGFISHLACVLQLGHPNVPIVFADTRPLAEDWTYRWLAAARAELGGRPSGNAATADGGCSV